MNSNPNKQLDYEIDSWRRTLNYLQQENVHMKNRLADILQSNVSKNVLENLERYQSSFLDKDTVIYFLKNDIHKLQIEGDDRTKNSCKLIIRKDMEKLEQEFLIIKSAFNRYLDKVPL